MLVENIMAIKFNSVNEVKEFVEACSRIKESLMESGIFRINGKFILSMLHLDLSKPVNVFVAGKHPVDFKTKFNTL